MIEHGTMRGYRQHRRAGEEACDACKAGSAKYQRQYTYRRHFNNDESLMVPALGAHRRIRALQRMGWRLEDIAAIAAPTTVADKRWTSMVLKRTHIQQKTHEGICKAYEQLSAKRGPSQQNATLALKRGWYPPLAWDEETIDDPNAKPQGYLRPADIKKLVNGKA